MALNPADRTTLAAMREELARAGEVPGGAVLLWSTAPGATSRLALVDRKDQTGAAAGLRARLEQLGRQVYTRPEALAALAALEGEG